MKLAAFGLLLSSALAYGQSAPMNFPEGSEVLNQEQLNNSLTDRVFIVNTAQGPAWRWEFKSNGYFYMNIGSFNDSGKWSAKGSSICSEGRQITASCNEVRIYAKELYLKRDNGEVVKLTAK